MSIGSIDERAAPLDRLRDITTGVAPLDEKVRQILELGCEIFGLPLAIVSRVEGAQYEVRFSFSHAEAPPPGSRFDLAETYCVHTLNADGPTGFHHVGASEIRKHPCYAAFGLEAYFGTPLIVDGERCGTLNFSSAEPHERPFDDRDRWLIQLFANWIGNEIFRSDATRELARRQALFEAFFLDAPDALVWVDTERRIQLVNGSLERLFGYTREELIGRTTELLYADPADYVEQGRRRYNRKAPKASAPFNVDYRRKDGSAFPSETVGIPIKDARERVMGYLAHIRDITDRKRSDELKDGLISTISHELRTPLTAVNGSLSLLTGGIAGDLPPQVVDLLEVAHRNCERLKVLVDDIIDVERLASSKMPVRFEWHPLATLLDGSIANVAVYAAERGVMIDRLEFDRELSLRVDVLRFEQVMSNLLSNAVKFSPDGGVVAVSVSRSTQSTRISVRDRGPGIPHDFRERVFERFARADISDRRQTGGTGLGLSIAKALVELMGGTIGFADNPGGGTIFSVCFPDVMPD